MTTSAFALWSATGTGCDVSNSSTNPRPHCPADSGTNCGFTTSGGSTGSSSSSGNGGTGGSAATNDVTGNVGVLNDTGFSQVAPYIGAATIVTTSTTGATIESPYGETTTTFELPSVMKGATWFFVQDQTVGATGIFSTHSVVNVPVSGPITLPVVDRNVITAIAGSLPAPIAIDDSRGVIVMKVVRNGQALSGVSLTTPLSGATIAYDMGVGLYSNQATSTGQAGVIVALNVDGPSTAETIDLTLTDVNQQAYFVQIKIQAGSATFAGYDL